MRDIVQVVTVAGRRFLRGLMVDIGEQKQAHRRLESSRAVLRAEIDAVPTAILGWISRNVQARLEQGSRGDARMESRGRDGATPAVQFRPKSRKSSSA